MEHLPSYKREGDELNILTLFMATRQWSLRLLLKIFPGLFYSELKSIMKLLACFMDIYQLQVVSDIFNDIKLAVKIVHVFTEEAEEHRLPPNLRLESGQGHCKVNLKFKEIGSPSHQICVSACSSISDVVVTNPTEIFDRMVSHPKDIYQICILLQFFKIIVREGLSYVKKHGLKVLIKIKIVTWEKLCHD